jgi:hypothetical protein
MGAYDSYFSGKLEDYAYPEEAIKAALERPPKIGDRGVRRTSRRAPRVWTSPQGGFIMRLESPRTARLAVRGANCWKNKHLGREQ